ncbi:MAG TPA: PDZ domain-containing protein, partial [Candidatus Polarisedimenticolaceae bacterium]|nr:PDZ domain-containing protein [Candidatus Polarisedimenticolaceae bacterium]
VEAGKEALLGFELVPNARTVVLGTVPADVAVSLDGEPVGLTATSTDDGGIGEPEARLVIEDVPLGEHVFELSKECFRTERLSDNLNVDLLTREPKHYKTVRMVPARTQVTLRGGPSDGQLTIDDRPAGRLSGEPVSACPGDRTFVVSVGGRVVWQHDVTLRDAVDEVLEVAPRPNLVRVGTERWPRGLEAFGAAFNLLGERELPRGRDLLQADAWEEMRLPDAVDLALAVVPPSRAGAPDRWYLYSPILDRAVLVDGDPPDPSRPQWTAVTWGFDVVDSEIGGANVVVGVEAGGTAATAGMKVGDRLVEIAGRAVASAAETRATLANARPEAPLRVAWTTAAGERREEELTGRVGPLLVVPAAESAAALVRAAWAAVDTLTRPELAAAAMANLALLFEAAGQPAAAVDAWRRVDWGDRPGVGEGTRQYYLGRALVRLGREAQALEALRKAAATRATAFSDDGPPIAPAAADHLADLGTTPD